MVRLTSLQNLLLRRHELLSSVQKRSFIKLSKLDPMIPEKLKPMWNHPAGPKTIFFWAPMFKWGLFFAGIADLSRDPSTISLKTPLSLAITGLIWSRYSLVITPKNYLLFSVNFLIAIIQIIQLVRVMSSSSTGK